MIKQVVCCGLLTLLFSCTYEEAWQTATTATTDNIRQFSLTMPSYMEAAPDNKLNPTAKLQYCNYYRNVYALVLDQNKTDAANTDTSLRQYANRYVRQMTSTMIKPQQIDSANTTIGGLPSIALTITGDLGQLKDLRERIYYRIAFAESPTHYYHIATWTWDSRRKNFAADLEKIMQSFREIE